MGGLQLRVRLFITAVNGFSDLILVRILMMVVVGRHQWGWLLMLPLGRIPGLQGLMISGWCLLLLMGGRGRVLGHGWWRDDHILSGVIEATGNHHRWRSAKTLGA